MNWGVEVSFINEQNSIKNSQWVIEIIGVVRRKESINRLDFETI